jgi:hypothetical protein
MEKDTFPQPENFESPDEWISALEIFYRSHNFKPFDPFGLNRLCAQGVEAIG